MRRDLPCHREDGPRGWSRRAVAGGGSAVGEVSGAHSWLRGIVRGWVVFVLSVAETTALRGDGDQRLLGTWSDSVDMSGPSEEY